MLQISWDSSAVYDSPADLPPLQLVMNNDQVVANYVGERLNFAFTGRFHCIGLRRGPQIVGGVVYTNYCKEPPMVEASIAMDEPNWASVRTLRAFFGYPFLTLHVKRLQTRCEAGNKRIKRFNEKLGFTYEGRAREAWPLGGDAWVFSMLPDDCKWIRM